MDFSTPVIKIDRRPCSSVIGGAVSLCRRSPPRRLRLERPAKEGPRVPCSGVGRAEKKKKKKKKKKKRKRKKKEEKEEKEKKKRKEKKRRKRRKKREKKRKKIKIKIKK